MPQKSTLWGLQCNPQAGYSLGVTVSAVIHVLSTGSLCPRTLRIWVPAFTLLQEVSQCCPNRGFYLVLRISKVVTASVAVYA